MPVRADIVVTKPDSPEVLLVAEVKTGKSEIQASEEDLKRYMVTFNCPVGPLVTQQETLFYRNPYTGHEGQTIQKIGQCATRDLLGPIVEKPVLAESDLEQLVERWLDNLRVHSMTTWPETAREAIESRVLPVLLEGVVRAGGPRWRRTGS